MKRQEVQDKIILIMTSSLDAIGGFCYQDYDNDDDIKVFMLLHHILKT